jgi:hypothetical protein
MDDGATPITGGCLCGAVRFTISAPPMLARACWCRLCQAIGAGSATVNVVFPSDALSVTGETRDYACLAQSGSHMHRRFCPTCGTTLFSAAEERPQVIIVRAGALDDPEIGRPAMTIWTSEAPSWACIDTDLPQAAHQSPPAK